MEQKVAKRWFRNCILTVLTMLGLIIVVVYIFDPYFHFHKPFSFVSYRLYDERYINDGISRHFEFDTIITGTSMVQNFKTSELDALYGGQSVKETFSGAGYQEISQNLERALERNDDLKTVFWGVDYNGLIRDKAWCSYENYPDYMYDDIVWNDVAYVFNKDVLYHGVLTNIAMTLTGQESTTMDEYSSWRKDTGLEYIMQTYDRENHFTDVSPILREDEAELLRENITQNIVDLANKYPDITFYLFYTPYSICYWDNLYLEKSMERQFQAEQLATELMLDCPNIKLYNFFDQYDVITDTDNYRDKEHYAYWINSQILEWMAEGTGLVTKDNYLERLEKEREFYTNYDYEAIYE